MKITRALLLCLALVALTQTAVLRAQSELEKKIAGNFFLPELIIKTHEMLHLSEDQKTALHDGYESSQTKVGALNERLQKELEQFNDLTKQRKLDAEAIFAQGDKVLAAEREVKRAQLALLILIKNTLTPEQQATLNGLKALEPKLQQVSKLAEKWKAGGKDVSQFEPLKAEFETDLKDGRVKEAEAVLERAMKLLTEKGAN